MLWCPWKLVLKMKVRSRVKNFKGKHFLRVNQKTKVSHRVLFLHLAPPTLNLATHNSWKLTSFSQITLAMSINTDPILGLFVLISMHFHAESNHKYGNILMWNLFWKCWESLPFNICVKRVKMAKFTTV